MSRVAALRQVLLGTFFASLIHGTIRKDRRNMSNLAIHIENIGKRYRYGEVKTNINLREDIAAWVRGWMKSNGKHDSLKEIRERQMDESPDYFWALKDINLDISHGEVVGIIGRNGAGKSTLLKILSRITAPSTGKIVYNGRIASLLEVGTGFHRDLTGRENVFLNGSILGMRRNEIKNKFDEIVAFAEVEKFIDTPVKFYSSGMYVRLAFAVAAHLEPEILVIDEVLAVGDAAFQRKCLGKMGDVAKQGRTVLFVSHNMTAVISLCTRGVWLNQGRIVSEGGTREVVQNYLQSTGVSDTIPLEDRTDRDGSVRAVALKIENADAGGIIRVGSRLRCSLAYRGETPLKNPRFRLEFHDFTSSAPLCVLDNEVAGGLQDSLPPEGVVTCLTDPLYLTPGRCFVNVIIYHGKDMADEVEHATCLDVETEDIFGTGKMPSRRRALFVLKQAWQWEPAARAAREACLVTRNPPPPHCADSTALALFEQGPATQVDPLFKRFFEVRQADVSGN